MRIISQKQNIFWKINLGMLCSFLICFSLMTHGCCSKQVLVLINLNFTPFKNGHNATAYFMLFHRQDLLACCWQQENMHTTAEWCRLSTVEIMTSHEFSKWDMNMSKVGYEHDKIYLKRCMLGRSITSLAAYCNVGLLPPLLYAWWVQWLARDYWI